MPKEVERAKASVAAERSPSKVWSELLSGLIASLAKCVEERVGVDKNRSSDDNVQMMFARLGS